MAVVEGTPTETSKQIKLDSDNKNNNNDDMCAAFEEIKEIKAIKVEDKGNSILD